jgi:hypothetical protein
MHRRSRDWRSSVAAWDSGSFGRHAELRSWKSEKSKRGTPASPEIS